MKSKVLFVLVSCLLLTSCNKRSHSSGKGAIQPGNTINSDTFNNWAENTFQNIYTKAAYKISYSETSYWGQTTSFSVTSDLEYRDGNAGFGFYAYNSDDDEYDYYPFVQIKSTLKYLTEETEEEDVGYQIEYYDNYVLKAYVSGETTLTSDDEEFYGNLYYEGATQKGEKTIFYQFDKDGYLKRIQQTEVGTLIYPNGSGKTNKTSKVITSVTLSYS